MGVRIVSDDGETTYVNRALLDIYGYSDVKEIDSVPYDKLYTRDSYAGKAESVRKGQMGEQIPSNYEIDIVRKTGEIRRLIVSRGEVLWNGERKFQMLYQDITERRRTEKALLESYDKLDKTLDAVIQTMALTVEMKDPYTAGHQHRVARLACAIAAEMGLSPIDKGNRCCGSH